MLLLHAKQCSNVFLQRLLRLFLIFPEDLMQPLLLIQITTRAYLTFSPDAHRKTLMKVCFERATSRVILLIHSDVPPDRRGFYPKGKGELTVTITKTVNRGQCLPAFSLTERGDVTRVHVRAFTAGALPQHVSEVRTRIPETFLITKSSGPGWLLH